MILIVRAHPYPQRSRAGRALLEAVHDLPDLEVRSLYDLYPDFDIDVAAEQAALARALSKSCCCRRSQRLLHYATPTR